MKDAFIRALFRVFVWLGARFFGACRIYSQSEYIKAIHFGVNEWHLYESVKQLAREDEVPKE